MKILSISILILVLLLAAGCQSSEPTLVPTRSPAATQPSTMTSDTPAPIAQDLVQKAQAQLAQKLGISSDSIFVFSVEAVEWPDASLGCPQADISYAQVVTPGYRITLEAEGKVYTFHTDQKEHVILCNARGPDEIFLPP